MEALNNNDVLIDLLVKDRDKYKELWDNFPSINEDVAYLYRVEKEKNHQLNADITALENAIEYYEKIDLWTFFMMRFRRWLHG